MQFEVGEQLREPIGSVHSYQIDEQVDLGEEGELPVRGKVDFVKTRRGLLVTGDLEAQRQVPCDRGLGTFNLLLPFRLEEEFLPTVNPVVGGTLPPPEDETTFTINERQVLDLTDALRQYILLAVPLKHLCRPGCLGLCPRCGYNLNQGPHTCPKD